MRDKLGTKNQSDDKALEELFASMGSSPAGDDDVEESWPLDGKIETFGRMWLREISEEVESKYLTTSWWLLHVGWKDERESEERRRGSVQWVSFLFSVIFFFVVGTMLKMYVLKWYH